MSEIEKAIAILADKAICEFCEDCGNDEVCIKCKTVYPVTAEELRMFYKVAGQSLLEKRERENPQTLGLEELKSLSGEDMPLGIDTKPIYVELNNYHGLGSIKGEELGCFAFALPISDEFWYIYSSLGAKYMYKSSDYGKTWIAYRHKPKHIGEATNMVEGE